MTSKSGISIKFTGQLKYKSIVNKNNDSNNDKESTDFVTHIDDKTIHSTKQSANTKELVIPLIKNNRYVVPKHKRLKSELPDEAVSAQQTPKTETLDEMAKRELINDANCWDSDQNEKTHSKSSLVIDQLIRNKVPDGYEDGDKLDASLRPEEPTLCDYQSVPVEDFGLAMLRGMGWKHDQNNKISAPIEPNIRPKGLGLGAEIMLNSKNSRKTASSSSAHNDIKEQLPLEKGSYVLIEYGSHTNSYGKVEGFDDQMSRASVQLAINKKYVDIPIAVLRVVTKKEYQTEGKVINKSKYDEYKRNENDKYHKR